MKARILILSLSILITSEFAFSQQKMCREVLLDGMVEGTTLLSVPEQSTVAGATYAAAAPNTVPTAADAAPTATRKAKVEKKSFFNPGFNVSRDAKDLGKINLKITKEESLAAKTLNYIIHKILNIPIGINKISGVAKRFLEDKTDRPYFVRLSDAYKLKLNYDEAGLANIPKTGPLLIVSNHPMNGIDGVAIAAMISKVRPDVKIVLTKFLADFPDMLDNSILVNPYGGAAAKRENLSKKAEMDQHLQNGGALVIFPSGTVSLKEKLSDTYATDPVWRTGAAQMVIRNPQTAVLPIFVGGQPTQRYQIGAKIGGPVQLLMHIKEISSRIDSKVAMVVGTPVAGKDLVEKFDPQELMNNLKVVTYTQHIDVGGKPPSATRKREEIIPPVEPALLENEIQENARKMFEFAPERADKGMVVYMAKGDQIPHNLLEVGRAREVTFRDAKEGSGKSHDNDEFDPHYTHLIVKDKKPDKVTKQPMQIAGGYRLGFLDEIMAERGIRGVYSTNYFEYPKLLERIQSEGIELGRSFVMPQYQRVSLALPGLWGAIGRLLVERPHYRYLIGPVSISADYKKSSQLMMINYLMKHHSSPDAQLVQPRHPVQINTVLNQAAINDLLSPYKDIQEVDTLVKFMQGNDKQGVPPLIKMYLDLKAKFLAFDFDKDFNTVDGLILVDLTKVPMAELKKYLGEEGAVSYMEYHRKKAAEEDVY